MLTGELLGDQGKISTGEEAMLKSKQGGFSLIEIAVVLFIIVLLLGSILVPLHTRHNQKSVAETEKTLADIRDALYGYSISNGHLPCPDRTTGGGNNDGQEDRAGNNCAVTAGNLPWSTLGIGAMDAWGNRFRYVVLPNYAVISSTLPALNTPATLKACPFAGCTEWEVLISPNDPTIMDDTNAVNVVLGNARAAAVVISHGPNGLGAVNANTGVVALPPTTADELANVGVDNFVSRIATEKTSGVGEFDDLVIWIGRPALFKHMVAAGVLPK